MTSAGRASQPGPFLEALRAIVGTPHVLTDADAVAGHAVDWTGRFRGDPLAVVRPAHTHEVSAVVATCATAGVGFVPQGGNTGLAAGAVPPTGTIVVSTTRLTSVGDVDMLSAQMTLGAGVTLADAQRIARRSGLDVGIDLAARDSATVGGMAATNAGGIHVLRYGTMRARVAGIEIVLPDGSIVSDLRGLAKDTTGYDLTQLAIGSEGTLGIVTAVRLRLVPVAMYRATAMIGCADVGSAMGIVMALRRELPDLVAAELMMRSGLDLVRALIKMDGPPPTRAPICVLVEAEGASDPTDALAAALDHSGLTDDPVVVARDPSQRAALWQWRERHTEAINHVGPPVKCDISLPLPALDEFIADVGNAIVNALDGACSDHCVVVFGHVGDGNLHVNIAGTMSKPPTPAELERADRVEHAVLALAASRGGSIAAEHGVGRAKAAWLGLRRSDPEIAAQRRIKAAFDPDGIANPGCLFPV